MTRFAKGFFFAVLCLSGCSPNFGSDNDAPTRVEENSPPLMSEEVSLFHQLEIREPECSEMPVDKICSVPVTADVVFRFVDQLEATDKFDGFYYTQFRDQSLRIYAINPAIHSFICCDAQHPFETYESPDGDVILYSELLIPDDLFWELTLIDNPPFEGERFVSDSLSSSQEIAIDILSDTEKGVVYIEEIPIAGFDREVHVYRSNMDSAPDRIIYSMDGQDTYIFARALEMSFPADSEERANIAIVGVPSGDNENRREEYLKSASPNGDKYFAFSSIFTDKISTQIEEYLGFDGGADERILFGRSNGGTWAINFFLDFPEFSNRVVSLSPGGRLDAELPRAFQNERSIFIGQGKYEGEFGEAAVEMTDQLREQGFEVTYSVTNSGHSYLSWIPLYLEAIGDNYSGVSPPQP